MISFILLMLAVIVIGVFAILFIGTGTFAVLLVFGDVIIGGWLVIKVIKMILKRH